MPYKLPTPCSHPGCPAVSHERFCPQHKQAEARRYDEQRGSSSARGYDADWSRVRESYLAEHPICELCENEGRIAPTDIVHHKQRIADGGARLDPDNLMSVCRTCHDELHKGHVFRNS